MQGFGKNHRVNKIKNDKSLDENEQQLISQALKFHSIGKLKEAADKYQLFLDLGFVDQRVLSNYGVICIQLGQIDNAINLFKISIQKFPSYPNSYANLARLFSSRGKFGEAEKLLEKYIGSEGKSLRFFETLAIFTASTL